MKAIIKHWGGGSQPPVPEAVLEDFEGADVWVVEVEDLAAFIEKHGPMIVSPPGKTPFSEGWFLWYNGGSPRFTQR